MPLLMHPLLGLARFKVVVGNKKKGWKGKERVKRAESSSHFSCGCRLVKSIILLLLLRDFYSISVSCACCQESTFHIVFGTPHPSSLQYYCCCELCVIIIATIIIIGLLLFFFPLCRMRLPDCLCSCRCSGCIYARLKNPLVKNYFLNEFCSRST